MNILITGGAGFIGSNIARELLERGHNITILDDLSTGCRSNLDGLNVNFQHGDIRNREDVDLAMKSQDGVCHLAASVGNKKSIEDPRSDADANVLGTINILESMREHEVKCIVYSSSAGIFGEPQQEPVDEHHPCEPLSPYGSTKMCAEKLCFSYMHLYGIRAVSLRYFNVFGEGQRFDAYGNVIPIFAKCALEEKPLLIYGDGKQTRDFIHVRDIARVNAEAIEKKEASGAINVGTGQRTSIMDLALMVKSFTGGSVEIINGSERAGDVRHCTADTVKMTSTLEVNPMTNLAELVTEYLEWFRSE